MIHKGWARVARARHKLAKPGFVAHIYKTPARSIWFWYLDAGATSVGGQASKLPEAKDAVHAAAQQIGAVCCG